MNLSDLISRLETDENLEVEYKAAQGGLPGSLWETVSAFANTSGGWLLLGVSQTATGPVIQGVKKAPMLKQDLVNLMRNPQKISREVCGPSDIAVENVGGADILVLRIRAIPAREKPIYINGDPYRGTYVRRNEGDFLCTRQEVNRMMRDASEESADKAISKGCDWEDINRESFQRYRQRFRQFDNANPWNEYDDQRFLSSIGGWRKEKETGQEGFTRAALLMFGTTEAILNIRPRHLIDFRLLSDATDVANERWQHRLAWEGNLFDAFSKIYPLLVEPLKTPFKFYVEPFIMCSRTGPSV